MRSKADSKQRAEKVRVAVFTDNFDQKNGVCTTYRQMVAHAERTGRRLDLFCFSDSEDVETRGRVRIHRYKRLLPVPYYDNLSWDLAVHLSLQTTLSKVRCHVVHVAGPDRLGHNAMAMAHLRRLPVVGVYHTCLPEYAAQFIKSPALAPLVRNVTWSFVRGFYEQCRLVLATTEAMRERLVGDGLKAPIKVMGRGVDGQLFHPDRRTVPFVDPPVILYAGRLSIEKNLHYYADTLLRLRAGGLKFRAVFVGDGPLRTELEATLPWAEFRGFLEGEELARSYANADIFAFPSVTDTFGNVVLEAMASGLPCVVADVKGPGEIVRDGISGYVAPDPDQFQTRIADLVRFPGRRALMANAARVEAESHTWDAIFDQLWHRYALLKRGGIGKPRRIVTESELVER
ncbi:MAG: glycosyltransferase family 1 protein [Capsulimonadales bacterium]|nr:glycosyltransferase family 1 protein [Capsulimonadales bacterium]